MAKLVETHAAAGGATGGDGAAAGGRATGGRPSGRKKSNVYSQIIVLLSQFKQKVCKKKSAGYFGKREIQQQLLRVTKWTVIVVQATQLTHNFMVEHHTWPTR